MAQAYNAPPELIARILELSQPRVQEDMAQAMVVRTSLTGIGKRGITFSDKGKTTEARVNAKDTQITKAGQKIEASSLSEGMVCEITYYGNKGTAAKITCD
jgi:hypothetical protein